jgi:hypothetical protein
MADWKQGIRWAARQQQEEKRTAREHFRRTCQAWPIIAVATIPFGWLAFIALEPTLAAFLTALVFGAAVLVAEHLAR